MLSYGYFCENVIARELVSWSKSRVLLEKDLLLTRLAPPRPPFQNHLLSDQMLRVKKTQLMSCGVQLIISCTLSREKDEQVIS